MQKNKSSSNNQKRVWKPQDAREENIIKKLLQICDEKITSSLMRKIEKKDIQNIVDKIYNDEINFDNLHSMTEDELYDYIVKQERLF